MMTLTIKNIKSYRLILSFLFSIFIHSLVFALAGYLLNHRLDKLVVNTVYVEFLDKERSNFSKNEIVDQKKDEMNLMKEVKADQRKTDAYFYNFTETDYDTSALMQVYKESTLNVSLKYPKGWTYLDQNLKDKLDGITFWMFVINIFLTGDGLNISSITKGEFITIAILKSSKDILHK